MNLDSFAFTTEGGRSYNEDFIAYRENGDRAIYVVADGLGGHLNGEMASACVADSLICAWESSGNEEWGKWLNEQTALANQRLLELQREKRSNMKSTLATLLIDGQQAFWGNVGDSRVYYLHNRAVADITEDHSVAYKKYKAGQITKAQLGHDEDQSCLLRVLGNTERWEPDLYECGESIVPGDGFVLCSDGLWEYVYDEEILIDFLKSETAREWAEHLLLRAIDRIQNDNDNMSLMTVIVS
ncbi:MAG: protein phosphatase 2C domain-containing protein [Butyrivibrio sp.]|nr:protein phosphatase 2C domain-containing protein [Muribaculum sp.]MCM1552941.1 protein phosphatase 2C domain-containing protein [Butyrivibrio sp.]